MREILSEILADINATTIFAGLVLLIIEAVILVTGTGRQTAFNAVILYWPSLNHLNRSQRGNND